MLKSLKDYIKCKFYDVKFHFSDNHIKVAMPYTSFDRLCEMRYWIKENIKGRNSHSYSPVTQIDYFYFANKHDATFFKLSWGGK